ncbi:MAG: serine/threonine protein kinase [Ktedonobacterales bacterium]
MREQPWTADARWSGALAGEYRLEQPLGHSILGPLFAAQHIETQAPAYVRILGVPAAQTPEELRRYQAVVERQAGHIATLRHPYILPLIGFGLAQGVPYLAWPYPAMRSLTVRLAQSGPLDVVTVGRYLDQLAGALEYAHEHATIHRNLSTDCIYLQLDGQLAVADFGVRRLFELLSAGSQSGHVPRYFDSIEACAPEQLLGATAETYTDVYALGAVTYRLLTGQPPFVGDTLEELAQRHLRAAPPPLARWRAGLPAELDLVLGTALAKEPAQRFQHPGLFANTYHRVITPAGTRRVPFAAPSEASAAPAYTPADPRTAATVGGSGRGGAPSDQWRERGQPTPHGTSPGAVPLAHRGGRILAAVLLLVVFAGGGLAFVLAHQRAGTPTTPSGTVVFLDSTPSPAGSTDALQVNVSGLVAPPSGSHYQAWLINQASEQILALGSLVTHPHQTGTLTYAGAPLSGGRTQNILAIGSAFEITLERAPVEAPSGAVVLSAAFPPQAFVHIKHLLLSFPTTPGTIGLLVGVLQQTRDANLQAKVLQQAAAGAPAVVVQCYAQIILNILEGSHGQHYRPLPASCTTLGLTPVGDGFGLLDSSGTAGQLATGSNQASLPTGYIADAADHASLAATTPDATAVIRQHAAAVQTALTAVKASLIAADAAAVRLLTVPGDTKAAAALVTDCAQAYGTPGSGTVSATAALGAYQQGQLMATLSLK